jgi:uncharacterized protein YggE
LNVTLLVAFVLGTKLLFTGELIAPDDRFITVSAEGKTVVAPDIARASFSVVTEGADPEAIQEENNEKVNDAVAFVKSLGIGEKDIKTSNYSIYPRYDYSSSLLKPDGEPRIIGYRMTQTISLTIRDLESVSEVLAGLPSRGINQVSGISFDIDDPDAYLNEAREEAFDKAREKAEAMARANGARIKRVITFSEGGGYPIPYYARSELALDAGVGGATAAPTPPPIEPGSEDVTVTVSVTYEIR